jgi:CsoR family transcriptional regulator, copper-sensing transcriptional repressor
MTENKQQILIGLKKARSLTDKLITMTENGAYCIDIMQQNLAAIGLLKSAHQMLMERHLKSCFKNAIASTNKTLQARMVNEILQVNRLASK